MTSNTTADIPAYLLEHIKRIAATENFLNDYTIERAAGSNHGDGFMSDMVRITLSGKRRCTNANVAAVSDHQLALVFKLQPPNSQRQAEFKSNIVFEREVHFYTTVLPMLQRFQLDMGLNESNGFFGYPQCFGTSSDAVRNEYAIIMQDLRSDGYVLWNKFEPIRFENVKLLMEQLGRMHGLSFALRAQRPDEFQLIRELDDVMCEMLTTDTISAMIDASYDQAIAVLLKDEDVRLMTTLKITCREWLTTALRKFSAEPFSVLGHGDCWNNNMMFVNNEVGPVRICLLDWQLCRFSSPVMDLSYFLLSSTDKSLRDRHYDEFIQIYYDNVAQTIRKCGSDPERLFTFANLQSEFQKFGKYGVCMAPILLQVLVSDPSNLVDLNVLSACDSSIDGDSGSAKESSKSIANLDEKSLLRYRDRLADVIADAKKYGWI